MATIIGLPKLSPTMEEGVLAKWHKKEGDKISPGDIVAEVETDKANMDFPIEDEGTILKLLVAEGETVKLGAPVAILGEQGEDITGLVEKASAGGAAAAPAAAPAAAAPAPAAPAPPSASASAPAPAASSRPAPVSTPPAPPSLRPPARQPAPAPAPKAAPAAATSILASPLAKTLAAENGVDLRAIHGTGPGGRIVERDVRAAMNGSTPTAEAAEPAEEAQSPAAPAAARASVAQAQAPAPTSSPPGEEFVDKSLSLMRKTIARRLTESKQQVPHFYLTGSCDAAQLLGFRAALNAVLGDTGKITLNDLVVKAAALALRKVPAANASFLGDRIRTHGRVNMGVAVSVDEGLITPVVHDADQKSLRVLSTEIRDLAERARTRKLTTEELSGGTFTVSNLGMYGIDHFQAIVNPPEGAILAVGAVKKVPVVEDDEIVIGERMSLTLSCDHRVVDGALGARLLAAIVGILEHPAALAL